LLLETYRNSAQIADTCQDQPEDQPTDDPTKNSLQRQQNG
jgi:hypothetical protein